MSSPDVVVVGAGHNGLVAACYLARAGLEVEVLERDTVVGGAVSTVERFPGHKVDRGSSLHVMVRWTGITEELELHRHGLRYLDCDPWGFLPLPGAPGGGITFRADLDATCDSIGEVCGPQEARAYRSFAVDWAARTRPMMEAFNGPPGPGRLGKAMWAAGKHLHTSGMETGRQFLSSGDAVLDECLGDERLKAALAWMGAQSGPPMSEPGTAGHLGWSALMHERPPGRPVGGSGALTAALVSRLESDGGRLTLGDAVTRIELGASGVSTVVTEGGRVLRPRRVVAACHVLTALGLLTDDPVGDDRTGGELTARARRTVRVGDGIGVALRLATTALPDYPDAPPDVHSGLGMLAADRSVLAGAYGDYLARRPPATPPALVMGFSGLDPTIAPPGRHTVTVWGQWYPYALATGDWEGLRERVTADLLARVDEVAPGFSATVTDSLLQTPVDLERELGLLRGNVMHLEMSLPSMFGWRPLPELSGYRTPVRGLYLAGASTHPGGGVSGASGRSAARVVLDDVAPPGWGVKGVRRRLRGRT